MSANMVLQGELQDKFSDLPEGIIDTILSLIPLQDGVRTSTLSTKWRLHWTRTQTLILDWDFFDEVLDQDPENDIFDIAQYVTIVDNILQSHTGQVHKFYLHVPHFGLKPLLHPNAINNWIHSVSHRGVQDLTLEFEDAHQLPSSLFQCMKLKHLSLRFVQLTPPHHDFRKLCFLISLDLVCASFSTTMVTSVIANCPLLEKLSIDQLGYDPEDHSPLILTAPKLKHLYVKYLCNIFFFLENLPNISTHSIQRTGTVEFVEEDVELDSKEGQDIADFFGAVSKVEFINLHSDVLLDVPERLPAPLERHTSLIINDMDMSSLEQLRSLFCLILSSPKLETLDISMCMSHNVEPQGSTRDYLQSQVKQVYEANKSYGGQVTDDFHSNDSLSVPKLGEVKFE